MKRIEFIIPLKWLPEELDTWDTNVVGIYDLYNHTPWGTTFEEDLNIMRTDFDNYILENREEIFTIYDILRVSRLRNDSKGIVYEIIFK